MQRLQNWFESSKFYKLGKGRSGDGKPPIVLLHNRVVLHPSEIYNAFNELPFEKKKINPNVSLKDVAINSSKEL